MSDVERHFVASGVSLSAKRCDHVPSVYDMGRCLFTCRCGGVLVSDYELHECESEHQVFELVKKKIRLVEGTSAPEVAPEAGNRRIDLED